MIPRRLTWVLDAAALGAAFAAVYWGFPLVQPRAVAVFERLAEAWPALRSMAPSEGAGNLLPVSDLAWVLFVVIPPALLALEAAGASGELTRVSPLRLALACAAAMAMGLGLASLVLFVLRIPEWSRLFIFLFGAAGTGAMFGYRLLLRWYLRWRRQSGYYTHHVLLIGGPQAAARLGQRLAETAPQTGREVAGYLDSSAGAPPAEGAGGPARLGRAADLPNILMLRSIQEVIAIVPEEGGAWVAQVVAACDAAGMPLRLAPEALLADTLQNLRPDRAAGLPVPAAGLTPRAWSPNQVFAKRVMDVLLAGALLIALAPLLACIALAVRLTSPGPILYRWTVIGQKGREFVGYKFRTMVAHADALKADLMPRNEMSGPVFKMTNDPRITRVGRFLRKHSLDELPQLYSVLKGDMSLVGPRPAFRSELERFDFWHKRKLSIRPGMTCLWQVRGRQGARDFSEWIKMDLEYIDNWSLWLDLKILWWTFGAVMRGTGR